MKYVLRLALLPLAVVFAWVASDDANRFAMVFPGLLLGGFIGVLIRGLEAEMENFEKGILVTMILSVAFSLLPVIASRFTYGVCTDHVISYEIALFVFMYLGMALCIYLMVKPTLNKPFQPEHLEKRQVDALQKLRRWHFFPPILLLVFTSAMTIPKLCNPDVPSLMIPHAFTLPSAGILFMLLVMTWGPIGKYHAWKTQNTN